MSTCMMLVNEINKYRSDKTHSEIQLNNSLWKIGEHLKINGKTPCAWLLWNSSSIAMVTPPRDEILSAALIALNVWTNDKLGSSSNHQCWLVLGKLETRQWCVIGTYLQYYLCWSYNAIKLPYEVICENHITAKQNINSFHTTLIQLYQVRI